MKQKKAFSLIELIISIVIIAITSVSIPMIISATVNANKKAIAQEALLNARTFLKVVTSSAFTCDYILEHPYSQLPRFTMKGYSNGIPSANKRSELNYSEGNSSTGEKPYNFYTKYGLNDKERRIFFNYLKTSSSRPDSSCDGQTLCEASRDGQKRCIQDFVNAYSSLSTVNYTETNARDFISPYKFSLAVAHEHNPYRNVDGFLESKFELKHVRVDMQEPIRIRLLAIVANIGDAPILQTRVWK